MDLDHPDEMLAAGPSSSDGTVLELSAGDRWLLLMFAAALFVLLGIYAWRLSAGGHETIEIRRQVGHASQFQLDMNSATWVEWMQLDGLGEVTARRITDDRDLRGPFRSVDDLQRVKGIGPVTLEKLRPHLRCRPSASP